MVEPSGRGRPGDRHGDSLTVESPATFPDVRALLDPETCRKVSQALRLTAVKMQVQRDIAMRNYFLQTARLFEP